MGGFSPEDALELDHKASGRIPDGTQGASARYYEFEADSGTTYLFAWNEAGSRIALGVTRLDGLAEYTDSAPQPAGFAKAIAFPCKRTTKFRLRVSGLPGCGFELSMTASKGLPDWFAAPDSLENDFDRSRAASIATDGSWLKRTLSTSGTPDIDWIRFDVDSGWSYSVSREDSLDKGVSGRIFDADSQLIGEFGAVARRKTAYYYRVTSTTGRGGSYRVKILASRGFPGDQVTPDAYEDDNTLAKAKPIAPDSIWQEHTLSGYLDNDLLTFHADSGTTYRLYIQESDTAWRDMKATFRRGDSVQVPYERPVAVREGTIYDFSCARSGKYFIGIQGGGTHCYSYRVAMTTAPGIPPWSIPDPGEPDSGISSATLIPADSTPLPRNLRMNDTDWLRIEAKAGTVYTLHETVPSTSYTWVGTTTLLLDEHGRPIDSIVLPKSNQEGWLTFLARKSGPLYLKLSMANPYHIWASDKMTVQYRLSASTPPTDPMEPDETMESAARLTVGAASTRRWVAASDVDWLVFHADSGRASSIFLEKGSRDTKIAMELFSPDSQKLAEMTEFVLNDGASIRHVARHTGDLYIRITPKGSGVQGYGIRVVSDSASPGACTERRMPCGLASDSSWIKIRIPRGDSVWLAYPVTSGTFFRFEQRGTPGFKTFLYSETGKAVDSSTASPTTGRFNIYRAFEQDGYIVVAVTALPQTDSSFEFRMAVSPTRGIAGHLTPADAYDLDRNSGPLDGTVWRNTKTYLKFLADTSRVYSFRATSLDGKTVGYSVVDSTETPVYPLPGTGNDFSFRPNRSGTWLVWLQCGYNDLDAHWRLERSSAAIDSYEPDDSISSAKAIATEGTPQNRMIWGGENDWVRFDVDSGTSYSVKLHPETGTLVTSIHSADFQQRAGYSYWYSSVANQTISYKAPRTEPAYLLVQGTGPFIPGAIRYSVEIRKLEATEP